MWAAALGFARHNRWPRAEWTPTRNVLPLRGLKEPTNVGKIGCGLYWRWKYLLEVENTGGIVLFYRNMQKNGIALN
jgi:hypothetical protein